MSATEVFTTQNSDDAEAEHSRRTSAGERVISFWEQQGIELVRFDDMSEAQIKEYIDTRADAWK